MSERLRRIVEELEIGLNDSRDDAVVPFAHLDLYKEKLPQATIRVLDGCGHQFDDDLSDVAVDIRGL